MNLIAITQKIHKNLKNSFIFLCPPGFQVQKFNLHPSKRLDFKLLHCISFALQIWEPMKKKGWILVILVVVYDKEREM